VVLSSFLDSNLAKPWNNCTTNGQQKNKKKTMVSRHKFSIDKKNEVKRFGDLQWHIAVP